MATEGALTAAGYIAHHLTNLKVGSGFWTLHLDTLLVSGILGLLVFGAMASAAHKATAGVPSGLQNFFELIVTFIDQQVKDTYHGKSPLVTPLAITIFVWVFVMNAMDLIPVDFLPLTAQAVGVNYLKVVPTTDPNLTFAMSLTVFVIMLGMNFKVKGVGGFAHEVFTAPFGAKLAPVNLLFRIVEDVAKPISLSLRLFGNIFGEETLVATMVLLGAGISYSLTGSDFVPGLPLQFPFYFLGLLSSTIQALVFTLLSTVYIALWLPHDHGHHGHEEAHGH